MSDVIAFLNARIDDDEERANAYNNLTGTTTVRILREVTAKRGVIREMEAARTNLEERGINVPFFITWTLWHLAAVYSDHPDYQKEWAI